MPDDMELLCYRPRQGGGRWSESFVKARAQEKIAKA